MKLVKVPFEEAVPFENYLTEMKHGWIEGQWDPEDEVCRGYYWHDMEWYPHALYKIVEDDMIEDDLRRQEALVQVLTERLTSAIHRLETIQETHPDICLDEDLKYLRGFDNGIQ